MRKIKFVSIVTLSILLLFASCKKDDDPSSSIQAEEYFINAKIDGVDFSATEAFVSLLALDSGYYTITAVGDDGNRITLTFVGPPVVGAYIPMVDDDFTSLGYTQGDPAASWFALGDLGAGEITITENSTTAIHGNFSFTGVMFTDTTSIKNITEGSFKAQKF